MKTFSFQPWFSRLSQTQRNNLPQLKISHFFSVVYNRFQFTTKHCCQPHYHIILGNPNQPFCESFQETKNHIHWNVQKNASKSTSQWVHSESTLDNFIWGPQMNEKQLCLQHVLFTGYLMLMTRRGKICYHDQVPIYILYHGQCVFMGV